MLLSVIKIGKQSAPPHEGHYILTTHKTESKEHALYHVDPKDLLTLVGDHTQATELKAHLEATQTRWSLGQHVTLTLEQHEKLIPAGVFSHPHPLAQIPVAAAAPGPG